MTENIWKIIESSPIPHIGLDPSLYLFFFLSIIPTYFSVPSWKLI